MVRLARFIVPGVPHHATQRGNGRQRTFFSDADYTLYRDLLKEHCVKAGVPVWSWVLILSLACRGFVPSILSFTSIG